MDRTYAQFSNPTVPPTVPDSFPIGYPQEGNVNTGTKATKAGLWWWHMMTEELRAVIVAAGLRPDPSQVNQVTAAIQSMIADASSSVQIFGALADMTSAENGAGLVGFNATLDYEAGSIGAHFVDYVSITDGPWFAVAGETDSTSKIQACIDWAFANGVKTVFVPSGTFNTTSTLFHRDWVLIRGASFTTSVIDIGARNLPVITLTSQDTTTAGARAAFGQSVEELTLKHTGLATPYTQASAHGVFVPFVSTTNFTSARQGRINNVLVDTCHTGLKIDGELFEYDIPTFRVQYAYRAVDKINNGACTTLNIGSLRMFSCFHGIRGRFIVYSSISFYVDHCGLNANSISFGPTNEMPIVCDMFACQVVFPYIGVEQTPAMLFRNTGFGNLSVLMTSYLPDTGNVWASSATRISNITQAQQALLCYSENSTLQWSTVNVTFLVSQGFPAAVTTASNLFAFGPADTSTISIQSSLFNVESYFWGPTANFAQNPTTGVIYSPLFEVGAAQSSYAFHRAFGKVQLVSVRDSGTAIVGDASAIGYTPGVSYPSGSVGYTLNREIWADQKAANSAAVNDAAVLAGAALLQSLGGGTLRMPAGNFQHVRINWDMSSFPNVSIRGSGKGATILTKSGATTTPVLDINASGLVQAFTTYSDFSIVGSSTAPGLGTTLIGIFTLRNITISGASIGWLNTGSLIATAYDVDLRGNGTGYRAVRGGTTPNFVYPNLISFIGGQVIQNSVWGFDFVNGQGITLDHVDIELNGVNGNPATGGVVIRATTTLEFNFATYTLTNNTWFEGNRGSGLTVEATPNLMVTQSDVHYYRAATTDAVIQINIGAIESSVMKNVFAVSGISGGMETRVAGSRSTIIGGQFTVLTDASTSRAHENVATSTELITLRTSAGIDVGGQQVSAAYVLNGGSASVTLPVQADVSPGVGIDLSIYGADSTGAAFARKYLICLRSGGGSGPAVTATQTATVGSATPTFTFSVNVSNRLVVTVASGNIARVCFTGLI